MLLNRSSQTSETGRDNLTAAPVIPVYAEPLVSTSKLKHSNRRNMTPDAHCNLVRAPNMSPEGEVGATGKWQPNQWVVTGHKHH